MTLTDLLAALDAGDTVTGGSPAHATMIQTSEEALRICAELNCNYEGQERVRELLGQLTGKPIDESVTLFPPFTSDFGKNVTIGKRVFINSGCRFQDQGGITIGDDCLIGHNAVIATLQHDIEPTRRADLIPFPGRHRLQRLARSQRHHPPGCDHRRRRGHRCRIGRHEEHTRSNHRGRIPRARHPRHRRTTNSER